MARTHYPRSCKLVQGQSSYYEEPCPQTPASRTRHARRSRSVPTKDRSPVLKQAPRTRTRTGKPNRALEARRRWFENIPECTIESDTSAKCLICDQVICLDPRRVLYTGFYENHLHTLGHQFNELRWEEGAAGLHRTNAENLSSSEELTVDAETNSSVTTSERNSSEPSPGSSSQSLSPPQLNHTAVRLNAALALLSIGQQN